MNSEIKRLQYEIKQLRKQNLEKQRQIKYIPLNIISNNLYINNSLSNKPPIRSKNSNYSGYNTFLNKSGNINNSSLSLNYKTKKKNKSYGKLPFKKGMFSYKNSLITSTPNITYKNIPNNNLSNIINFNYGKNNNNTSLLSANLKLNIDSDEPENSNNISQNIILNNRIPSSNSFDLSKYKISEKSIITNNKSSKNLINSNQKDNIYNNSSNIMQKKTYNNKNNNFIVNNYNNIKNKQNSIDNIKLSPVIPKIINKKEQNSSSMLIIDDYNENKNYKNSNANSNRINSKKNKIFDHFRNCNKNEKESRRLIIEYIKVLNRQNRNKNHNDKGDINKIMLKNNISKKVLNQELVAKEFNISNIFNNSSNNKNNSNDINSRNSSFNNPLINDFNNSVMNLNNNVLSKNFFSPIKNNINEFLVNMNDEKKDKINMVKFLSIPRVLIMSYENKKYRFVCLLCPNNICYLNGIESYIFKFMDLKSHKYMGGFDLIKVSFCSVSHRKQKNFLVQTFDGNINRNYEFETNSKENAFYYSKSINYLSQLEKCKIYNKKNIFIE